MRRALAVLAASVLIASGASLIPAGAAVAAPAGLTVTARLALRNAGGASVTVAGTYSCGPFTGGVPDRGVVDLSVTQSAVVGYGYLEPTVCDGSARWFAVEVTSVGERFRRGPAQWSASGYVEGDGGMQHGYVPPTPIRIR